MKTYYRKSYTDSKPHNHETLPIGPTNEMVGSPNECRTDGQIKRRMEGHVSALVKRLNGLE